MPPLSQAAPPAASTRRLSAPSRPWSISAISAGARCRRSRRSTRLVLAQAGLVRKDVKAVKVLGDGELARPFKITAAKFSATASKTQDREGRRRGDRRLTRADSLRAHVLRVHPNFVQDSRAALAKIFYTLEPSLCRARGGAGPAARDRSAPAAADSSPSRAGERGQQPFVGLYNMFTGWRAPPQGRPDGSLGIMPYISASDHLPADDRRGRARLLSRLQQEGDAGRQKLTQYTRYARRSLICIVQGTLTLILALENPAEALLPRLLASGHLMAPSSSSGKASASSSPRSST